MRSYVYANDEHRESKSWFYDKEGNVHLHIKSVKFICSNEHEFEIKTPQKCFGCNWPE